MEESYVQQRTPYDISHIDDDDVGDIYAKKISPEETLTCGDRIKSKLMVLLPQKQLKPIA